MLLNDPTQGHSQNPQPTNKEGCEIAYLNFHLLTHFECDSTCPYVCVFLILTRDVFISANFHPHPDHTHVSSDTTHGAINDLILCVSTQQWGPRENYAP